MREAPCGLPAAGGRHCGRARPLGPAPDAVLAAQLTLGPQHPDAGRAPLQRSPWKASCGLWDHVDIALLASDCRMLQHSCTGLIRHRLVAGSNSPVNGASVRRARSAEAESPPATQLYALRSRATAPPHRSPPGFGHSPDPEAAAAADHAASTTMGPIKSRLKVPPDISVGTPVTWPYAGCRGGAEGGHTHSASF